MITEDSKLKFYRSKQSAGVWSAGAVLIAVISVGPSFGLHSALFTCSLLLGIIAVWSLGYWLLSKTLYFVSSEKAGFKDLFRSREVQFAEVRSATVRAGRGSRCLEFQCDDDSTVRVPLDPMNESWLSDVKAELSKRGVAVTTVAFGFPTNN